MTPSSMGPIALTMGDPAGIGGEVTLKAWRTRRDGVPPFFVLDDPVRLESLAERLRLSVPITQIERPEDALGLFSSSLPVIPISLTAPPTPGTLDARNTPAVLRAIDAAVAFVEAGRATAVVTNPIHKKALYDAGFTFPGHTEYLAALAGKGIIPIMMLASPELRVVPVTVHAGLKDAIEALTTDAIVTAAAITFEALKRDFAIAEPMLAIAGLNPHAGEGGSMGREEETIIVPAIDALRERDINVVGPVPPDALFTAAKRVTYDAAICMYHDQALIPIKALDFAHAVNVTLGLPFIRTSPDHGTALDIAGQGIADATSLISALNMAQTMAQNQMETDS